MLLILRINAAILNKLTSTPHGNVQSFFTLDKHAILSDLFGTPSHH